jgi:hypothetical protein
MKPTLKEGNTMPHNDPSNYSLLTYIWVLILSIWGGITHNLKKVKTGALARFSLSELVGDLFISGFIGVMTFYLCEYARFDKMLTAFFVGMSSHMGTRGLMMLEDIAARKLGVGTPKDKDGQ